MHAAKTQLSRLIAAAIAGEEVVIAKGGKPIVVAWIPEQLEGPGAAAADGSPVVPLFRSMRRLMNAIKRWNAQYAPQAAPAS